jgi:TonB family protein
MPADIWPESPAVRGTLDREIIRRIVRRNIHELFACYEPALARRRHLAGKLTIEFTIDASGNVRAVALRRSTARDAEVAGCFEAAIRGWQFPRPLDGQKVIVSQRFTLVPPHRSDRSWKGGK